MRPQAIPYEATSPHPFETPDTPGGDEVKTIGWDQIVAVRFTVFLGEPKGV